MATRGEELNTRLTATDDASAVVDKVADKVGDLEDRPHEVELDANGEKVEREIETLDRRLAGLTDKQREIVLKAAADQAQRAVDRLTRDLANAQKFSDEEIRLRVEARGNAEAKLAAIQSELRELDGKRVTPEVDVETKGLREALRDLDGPLGDIASRFDQMSGRGGAGAAGGIAAVLVGLGAAVMHAAELAGNVQTVATLTGDTSERASRIVGVFGQAGFEAKDLADIVLQMNDVLASSPEVAERLGINLADGATGVDRIVEVTRRLNSEITDTGERGRIASQLFGEEGVRQVTAITSAVGDLGTAIDNYSGKLFSEEDIQRLIQQKREIAEIKSEWDQATISAAGFALDVKQGIEDAGYSVGLFFRALATGEDTFGNWSVTKEFEEAEERARSFDWALLDNVKTFAQAREIALAYTDSLHAANLIALEWARINEAALIPSLEQQEALADRLGSTLGDMWSGVIAGAGRAADEIDDVAASTDNAKGSVDALKSSFDELLGMLTGPLDEQVALLDIAEKLQSVAEARAEAGVRGSAAEIRALQGLAREFERFVRDTPGLSRTNVLEVFAAINAGDLERTQAALSALTADRSIRIRFDLGEPTVFNTSEGTVSIATPGGGVAQLGGGGAGGLAKNIPSALSQRGGDTIINNNTYYLAQPTTEQVDEANRILMLRNGPQ